MNIGLLEDNPAILELLKTVLELNGHTVYTYTEGRTLLHSLFGERDTFSAGPSFMFSPSPLPHDLLIVDLNLPDELSGVDVITSIYSVLSPNILPIIVVSAANTEQLNQIHMQFPTLSIVRKPFALKVLLQTISSSQSKKTEEEFKQ